MAYLTCPWCLTPQMVAEQADHYQCFTCYAEIRFAACANCGFKQTVNKKWTVYTCGNCESKGELPRRWSFAASTKAREVEGSGASWPRL